MFIKDVDDGLEAMLRARLPLPPDVGDIGFEAPTDAWSAQLSRLTVSLFLYSVERSNQPHRTQQTRVDQNGRPERRAPQPMIELGYLASCWAGSPADEHKLLSDVVSILAGTATLSEEFLPGSLHSSVWLNLGGGEIRPRDVWQGLGGKLKACVLFQVTVAADTFQWEDQAPAVERISVLASPSPVRPVG